MDVVESELLCVVVCEGGSSWGCVGVVIVQAETAVHGF